MKKNRGDEPIGVIIYIYIYTHTHTYIYVYIYITSKNVRFFSFFFYKIGEQEGGTGPAQGALLPV
jgi:hypothetical protein